MPGQAIVTIKDKQWVVDVASTYLELAYGLGGLVELAAGTGMLFDLGWEQTIEVTTVPMLFTLDIAFISEDMTVTEVYHNIERGNLVISQVPARYFLEVNADEMAGIESATQVAFKYLLTEGTMPATSDLISVVMPFIGFLVIGIIANMIMRDIVDIRH